MSGYRSIALLLGPALLAGCYTTTIRSGRLPDPRPAVVMDGIEAVNFDARIHSGFVYGVIEVGGNYNLEHICPQGVGGDHDRARCDHRPAAPCDIRSLLSADGDNPLRRAESPRLHTVAVVPAPVAVASAASCRPGAASPASGSTLNPPLHAAVRGVPRARASGDPSSEQEPASRARWGACKCPSAP